MKTFGNQDWFFNLAKLGAFETQRIRCEMDNEIIEKFKDIRYHINNFSDLNYLDQLSFVMLMIDTSKVDLLEYRDDIGNSKDVGYIRKIMNMLNGKLHKLCVISDHMSYMENKDNLVSFDSLTIQEKAKYAIFTLTGDLEGKQYKIYDEYINKGNDKYRDIYEMLVTVAEIIEREESFDVEREICNFYKASERNKKIEELFMD